MSQGTAPLAHRRTLRNVIKRNPSYLGLTAIILAVGLVALLRAFFIDDGGEGYWIALGAVAIIPFLAIPVAMSLRGKPREAEATAEGLAWRDRDGNHFRPWSDVKELFRSDHRLDSNTEAKSTVVFSDGSRVVLDRTLSDYETLAHEVQTRAADAMMSAIRAAVREQQQQVAFGPIAIESDGLALYGQFFPWGSVRCWNIHYGRLFIEIYSADRYIVETFAFSDIPNYLVVLNLFDEFGVRRPPLTRERTR